MIGVEARVPGLGVTQASANALGVGGERDGDVVARRLDPRARATISRYAFAIVQNRHTSSYNAALPKNRSARARRKSDILAKKSNLPIRARKVSRDTTRAPSGEASRSDRSSRTPRVRKPQRV